MPNVDARRPHVLVAGVSTRAMAESAARAGFAVTSLDAFGDLDQHPGVRAYSLPRDFCLEFSPSAVVEVARTIESDAVAYLSPFENHPALVEQLAEGRQLWGNDAAVLRRARDHRMLPSIGEVHADRWLLKPRASGGGHGIRWWTPRDPVPSGSYVQPYIEGAPGSIVFVSAGGNCVPLGLTIQLVGEPSFGVTGFRYCGSILCHSERSARAAPAEARNRGRPDRGHCHPERSEGSSSSRQRPFLSTGMIAIPRLRAFGAPLGMT